VLVTYITMDYNTLISTLKKNDNVIATVLFGSRTKGTEKPNSDYDICVFLKNHDKNKVWEIEKLKTEQFDVIPDNKLPFHVKVEVFKHGKQIFINDENKYAFEFYKNLREYQDNLHHYSTLRRYREYLWT